MHRTILPLLALALAAPAVAAPPLPAVVVAEQVDVRMPENTVLGGGADQRFAQVFRVGAEGYLSHVMLPLQCQAGARVRVTVQDAAAGVPSGVVRTLQDVSGRVLDGVPTGRTVGMRMVEFARPPLLPPGDYAFTLERLNKYDCVLWTGPKGDTYTAGKAYFIAKGNPPYWIELFDAAGPYDLAFQVFLRPL